MANETVIRIQVEPADVEDLFEAFRIEAVVDAEPIGYDDDGFELDIPLGADEGGNDVVLFTGVTWSEPGALVVASQDDAVPSGSAMHFSGHPGQLTESAEVVCITTDAVVIAATTGEGLLVRTGLKPLSLQVIRDRETIAGFLRERGYGESST